MNPAFYVVKIFAEGDTALGHEKRHAEFIVRGVNEADAVSQVRTWIMMALQFDGPVLMRKLDIAARFCEPTFVDMKHKGLEHFDPRDWLRFIRPVNDLPRCPDGTINNCSLKFGDEEVNCQMCEGNCPDRNKYV